MEPHEREWFDRMFKELAEIKEMIRSGVPAQKSNDYPTRRAEALAQLRRSK